jgi:hypothetical protein
MSLSVRRSETLLDNFHLVTADILDIRRNLPRSCYRELPKAILLTDDGGRMSSESESESCSGTVRRRIGERKERAR